MTLGRLLLTTSASAAIFAGAIGISGDGIDQDDLVSAASIGSIHWEGAAQTAFTHVSTSSLSYPIDAPEFGFDVSVQ